MAKTILFSPVGGTDPISQNNMHDGSLIHICRYYRPDIVYLYMSKEMLDFQEQDDRYRYCINELAKMQNREIIVYEIERQELIDVQEFDYFYEDFRKCILKIQSENDSDDTLLLNISSGTPAMKSGLLVLATLGEFDCKTIQVTTPTKSLNEHNHRDYENELWEINEDNEEGAINRCKVVYCPTLSNIKQTEIIKQLLREYDYKAALLTAKTLPKELTENYLQLLEVAYNRSQLLDKGLMADVNKYDMAGFPVKRDEARRYFEYALALDLKRRRGEYADFVRALSPIILDLFIMIANKECGIDIHKYTEMKRGVEQWSRSKLAKTDVEAALLKSFYGFDYKHIYSSHIIKVIEEFSNDESVKNIVNILRDVEEKVRNIAAHQVVAVTDKMIEQNTGYNASQVSELLKKAFKYTRLNIKDEYWDAYDTMNDFIISSIENS